jgi:hypothetical protein
LGRLGAAKLAASILQVNEDSIGGQVEIVVNAFPFVAKSKKLSAIGIEIAHHPRKQNQSASNDQPLNSPKNLTRHTC